MKLRLSSIGRKNSLRSWRRRRSI